MGLEKYLANKPPALIVSVNGKIIVNAIMILLPSDTPGIVLDRKYGKNRFLTGEIVYKTVNDDLEENIPISS